MVEQSRKKSPRAPSISLDEALERTLKAYAKERLHPAPTDVVAQNIGYKGANNGSALAALASLRYYGLMDRPSDGLLVVTKDVEAYLFAPSDELKRALLIGFLRRPPLFADLLDKYVGGLPSDANIKYELIQRGFLPSTADSVVAVFRRSVEFSGFLESAVQNVAVTTAAVNDAMEVEAVRPELSAAPGKSETRSPSKQLPSVEGPIEDHELDRIPVRLPGGRRAWLCVPTPLYATDKTRLKAQIDLLLTDDEDRLF